MRHLALVVALVGLTASGFAREAFSDPSSVGKRVTRSDEREDRQKKAAEEAKKKAEQEKRQQGQNNRQGQQQPQGAKGMTVAGDKGTSSGAKRGAGNRPAQQGGYGQGAGEGSKEVTESMLSAVKTQRVRFDPAKAEAEGILLLNEPVFKKADGGTEGSSRDGGVIGQPL